MSSQVLVHGLFGGIARGLWARLYGREHVVRCSGWEERKKGWGVWGLNSPFKGDYLRFPVAYLLFYHVLS